MHKKTNPPIKLQLQLTHKRLIYRLRRPKAFSKQQNLRTVETSTGYSYKPFDDKKAIFVHIPKCAGISVNQALFGNLAGGHTTFDQYLKIFNPQEIQEYFKFTIVRNPWDRLVSAYHFLKGGGFNETDAKWYKDELAKFDSFDEFVRLWVNKENILKWHHFRPQSYYFLDSAGAISLDFIGYFETLENDFEYIAQKIGCHNTLPSSNRSHRSNFQDYYCNETRAIVEKIYAEDIKLLGYDFHNKNIRRSG